MISLFENYSTTSNKNKNGLFTPFIVKIGNDQIKKIIYNYLKENNYEEILLLDHSKEIFGLKNGFELTINYFHIEGKGIEISTTVYGENKRGKTRKYLKNVLNDLRTLFKDYISNN